MFPASPSALQSVAVLNHTELCSQFTPQLGVLKSAVQGNSGGTAFQPCPHHLLWPSLLQGLYELDRAGMALADVKLDNLIVDFAYFCGGVSPLVKIVDFGNATNGTLWRCLHAYYDTLPS